MIKIPRIPTKNKIIEFFKKKNFKNLLINSKKKSLKINQLLNDQPYKPELTDLYNLYWIIRLNKRITSLEFGSGWSSLIIAKALNDNKSLYLKDVLKLRRNYQFNNFIVDNEKKYLNIAKNRIKNFDKKLLKGSIFNFSKCRMKINDLNYVTEFDNLPKVNPDFIYLDGPDQFNIINSDDGYNIDDKDLTPMAADILKIEFFLNPGTIILIDGRGANANFLKKKLIRNWEYRYFYRLDQHIFYLNEKPYGTHSKNLADFFNK